MSKEPMFPILGDPIIKAIPWSALRAHEARAKKNHGGQSLNRLSNRGGLWIEEAYCVIKDIDYPRQAWDKNSVRVALMRLVWEAAEAAKKENEG